MRVTPVPADAAVAVFPVVRLPYLDGLATTLAGAAIPYGYTLVVWSTGSVVAEHHGPPDVWDVAMFAGGAAVGYALLRLGARRGDVHAARGISQRGIVRASVLHASAISVAIAAAALLAWWIGGFEAWAAAPFAATICYLGGTAVSEAREIVRRAARS